MPRRHVARLGILALLALLLFARRAVASDVELETPRNAIEFFADAARRGDFARASEALDLHQVRADQRRQRGSELAQQLWVVLDRAVWIDLDAIPDDPKPKGDDKSYRVTTVRLLGRDVPITLTTTAKEPKWLFSAATIAVTPELFDEYGPGPIESRLPESLRKPRLGWLYVWQWLAFIVVFGVAVVLGRLSAAALAFLASRITARTKATWDDELVERLTGPMRLFLGLVALRILVAPLALSAAALGTLETFLKVAFIGVLGFAAVRVVTVASRTIEARAVETSTSVTGAMRARGITTQVRVLRRVINITVGVLAVALMLTQFETVRNVGVSLLASAGLAGVVLGFAAQRTIGSLIAGIQLSATQPIRIGDEVVIEKEFGVIEEITLTYVVVRLWDERRLIVPMTRFLEQPFENWTKQSSNIHGTVFLDVDPTAPVGAIRAEVERLVVGNPLWDGRTKSVQVVEAKERAMQVRILLSASNAATLFELRAQVRERMLAWLASFESGRFLVRTRVDEVVSRSERPRDASAVRGGAS